MKLSIIIITRNRAAALKNCLLSLVSQSLAPFEVIVIDNASNDNTKEECLKFKLKLPIKFFPEPRVGIPFARNKGITKANGSVLVFIDDDCMADKNWLSNIRRFFSDSPKAVGLIGSAVGTNPDNLFSLTEETYCLNRIYQNVSRLDRPTKIQSGLMIDFKNAAFSASFLKRFRFRFDIPFGDVGNEDAEIGYRIFRMSKNIYYVPSVKVKHEYSNEVIRIFIRNFWVGFSDEQLAAETGIRINAHHKKKIFSLLRVIQKIVVNLSFPKQIIYLFLILIYPLFSKAGGVWAKINRILNTQARAPVRS